MIPRSPAAAVIEWKRRTAKPLARRTAMKTDKPMERARKPIKKRGRRTKAWGSVWCWLKPKLKEAGRTRCEFDFLEHNCGGPLDPCHSKKRGEMKGNDIYMVAIGCRTVHDFLDGVYVYPPLKRRMNHKEMEEAVMRAINNHGGPILPAHALLN